MPAITLHNLWLITAKNSVATYQLEPTLSSKIRQGLTRDHGFPMIELRHESVSQDHGKSQEVQAMKMLTLFLGLLLLIVCYAMATTPGDVIKGLPATDYPTGLAWDGRHLWLADRDAEYIYAIDVTTGAIVDSVACPAFFPTGLAYGDGCLWIAGYYEDMIYKLDLKSRKVVNTLSAPSSQALGLAWQDGYLWAIDAAKDELVKLATDDGTPIASLKAPSSLSNGLTWDGTYLWVSDRYRDRLYMVEPVHGWVIMRLEAPGPYAFGLAWDGNSLWNVDYETDSLYAVTTDGDNLTVTSSPKRAKVRFTCRVRCQGPDPIEKVNIYLALPHRELPHQHLLADPTFVPAQPDFVTDRWGQEFAHFVVQHLEPGQTGRVSYEVPVELQHLQHYIIPEHVGSLDEIPADLKRKYTVDGSRLRINDPVIQKAIAEAVGDEANPYWIVRRIFEYVNDKIEYERVGGWDTAPNVLRRGTGSCSEYSFVFMAMARGAGIPTRFCAGVCERGDRSSMDDVFHRWTEVYLPNYGWLPIDASAGDATWQGDAVRAIGSYQNRILITTIGGGDSEYIGWSYNYGMKMEYQGRSSLDVSAYADWEPVE